LSEIEWFVEDRVVDANLGRIFHLYTDACYEDSGVFSSMSTG